MTNNKSKMKECTRHVSVVVSFDASQHEDCPLCEAEAKISEYEMSDT